MFLNYNDKNHLHPLGHVIKVIQMEEGVLQSGDGPVGVQQATHVEFVAVTLILRTRSSAHEGQRFVLKISRQHWGGGADTRLRIV